METLLLMFFDIQSFCHSDVWWSRPRGKKSAWG